MKLKSFFEVVAKNMEPSEHFVLLTGVVAYGPMESSLVQGSYLVQEDVEM